MRRHNIIATLVVLGCADDAPIPTRASLFGRAMSCTASNGNDFGIFADILALQFGYLAESQSTPCRDQDLRLEFGFDLFGDFRELFNSRDNGLGFGSDASRAGNLARVRRKQSVFHCGFEDRLE